METREKSLAGDQAAAFPAVLAAELESRRHGAAPRSLPLSRGRLVRRALVASDLAGLSVAFVVTAFLFGLGAGQRDPLALGTQYALFVLSLPGWALLAKLLELYDRDEERTDHSTFDDFVAVLHLVTLGSWLLFVVSYLTGAASPGTAKIAVFWLLALGFVTGGRAATRAYCRRHPAYVQNTLIVGAGDVGQLVGRKFIQHPEYGIRLVGFLDADPRALRADLEGRQRVLGPPTELARIVAEHQIERVVIAFSNESTPESIDLIRLLKRLNVQVDIVPRLFDAVGPNVVVHSVEGLPLLGLPSSKLLPYSRAIKRTLDVVGAGLLLAVTSPIFAVAAWRIRRDSPGPVFFRQTRLGEGMREFTALKFRTMKVDGDDSAHREFIKQTMSASAVPTANGLYKLDQNDRITASGRFLRKTSLDELPQLINVLRGEMSLVGPRPCLSYETEHFEPHHFERFLVPGGITGLWQVTARAHSTFGEALELDVAYARNWSLGLDLMLLLRTPFQLLRQRKGTA
jgi:exopolysaccharide biosynthesis polyprenyl glycosylphosphotransferase